jgi:hypothetical protein
MAGIVQLEDARRLCALHATAVRLDRVEVDKVTIVARPSGGTPNVAFVRSGGVHEMGLDDSRQLRSRDATVWVLYRVKVEKMTNAARPSGGTSTFFCAVSATSPTWHCLAAQLDCFLCC